MKQTFLNQRGCHGIPAASAAADSWRCLASSRSFSLSACIGQTCTL